MCKKISIYSVVIFLLILIFGCTNEPLINGLINQAQAFYPTTTTTTLATASPTASPTLNTYSPPATPPPTPNTCGSSGDSECNGKAPGDVCTITKDDNGNTLNYPIDGTCSNTCKCEFCETCNSCFGSFDAGSFIGSYNDSTTSNYNPGSTYSYRKMFNATSSLEQIGSDLRQIKESRKNKAYKKKSKFVRNYKENDDGTISVLVKSKVKESGVLTQRDSWLKFRVGDSCSKTTVVRGMDVPTGECKDPGPCKVPCEKCKRRNPTSTTDKCCFCRLNTEVPTNAQCSPDHDTPVVAGDPNSCVTLKGANHKCDAATCKCKCGNDDPCNVQCEVCSASVNPAECKLRTGNTCTNNGGVAGSFACNGTFNCDKSGNKCFCACNAKADCPNGGPTRNCCKATGETDKHCHGCCTDADCALDVGGPPKCCASNNKGQVHVCGNLNVDGCVPVAP